MKSQPDDQDPKQTTEPRITAGAGTTLEAAPRLRAWLPAGSLLAFFLLQWLLLMNIVTPAWDAAFYYSYGRSLIFDQELALENDLQLSYPTSSPDFAARQLHTQLTPTGSVHSPFAIGSGLLWLPLLAILRLGSAILGLPARSGFEWTFVGPVATFSAIVGLLAFYLAYRMARRETGELTAVIAVLTMSFASPLIYYQFREPLYAHAPSALFNTLFLVYWWRLHRQIPDWRHGLIIGALLGLSSMMRWQNAIYVILPLVSGGWAWLSLAPEERRRLLPRLTAFVGATGLASLIVFSPQLFVWQAHYGSWLTIPQGGSFMTWQTPFLRELLFSPFRGLFPWMPIAALALTGLLLQARRSPRLVAPLLILLAASLYVNASSRDWFAGGGYGPRRSIGELAIFVMGYAWLLQAIPQRTRMILGSLGGVVLALHQWLLLRYALAERIGGGVVSMAPDFGWFEVSLTEFLRQLAGHLPDLVQQPRDVFVLPGSPLDILLLTNTIPVRHMFSLAAAAAFVAAFVTLILFAGMYINHLWQARSKKAAQA